MEKILSRDSFCASASLEGQRCRARRTANSQFCFFHAPEEAAKRAAAQRAGGLKNRPAVLSGDTPDLQLASLQDITSLIAETINQTRRGEIDAKVANAVGYLASLLLKAIEKVQLEEQMVTLERAVKTPHALSSSDANI
jgi:hypothetical protein